MDGECDCGAESTCKVGDEKCMNCGNMCPAAPEATPME